jgi:hypothetical protein
MRFIIDKYKTLFYIIKNYLVHLKFLRGEENEISIHNITI